MRVECVLRFGDVSVRRGDKNLLHALTWDVAEGERWVVMGPNGAGKTTALQVAATRLHPTQGRVHVLGEEIGAVDIAELRQAIGWSSGSLIDAFPPQESVLDAVLTGAWSVTGRWREAYDADDRARAVDLLDSWGLSGLAGRTFGTLSEGERKRVLIARSLMADPELLLLDEPAAGLDLGGREALLTALSEFALDPLAPVTVLVTHHVEEVPTGFTHGLLLREGRAVAMGPLGDVLTDAMVSEAFGLPITVREDNGRWTARRRG